MGGIGIYTYSDYATGGCSCQSYDSINLTEGQIITMKIAGIFRGEGGFGTTFGNYSVDGGRASSISAGGTGSGNKGKDGTYQAVLGTKKLSRWSAREAVWLGHKW